MNGHAISGMMSKDLLLFGMIIVTLESQLHGMHNLVNKYKSWDFMIILITMCYKTLSMFMIPPFEICLPSPPMTQ